MAKITEDYVSFEVAKLLKEKGFPQEYDDYHALVYNEEDYEDEYEIQRMVLQTRLIKAGTLSSYPLGVPEPKCYCPSQSMAMKWLRETHDIDFDINTTGSRHVRKYHLAIWENKDEEMVTINPIGYFNKWEQACEAAIKYCLEHLI